MPPETAVHTMLAWAAAQAGRRIDYRVIVSTFEASLRVVAAGLGVSVMPRQVVQGGGRPGVAAVPLADAWAQRRFAICFRSAGTLPPAADRLLQFLVARANA
jgi:DNA-binding transcriptional LysR family regulator